MRPFYDMTKEDIANEIKAVTQLCAEGVHKNIVAVLNHGWLKSSPYYFIDMELCDFNLETFIYNIDFDRFKSDFETTGKSMEEVRLGNLWTITIDIVRGLHFIHGHGQVHRDLKPRNGIASKGSHFNSSSLFPGEATLEDCGFRPHLRRNVKAL